MERDLLQINETEAELQALESPFLAVKTGDSPWLAETGSVFLSASVGQGSANRPSDVRLVQRLLNAQLPIALAPLVEDGYCGPKTIVAIKTYQQRVLRMDPPDGRVDPGGRTFRSLSGGITPPQRGSGPQPLPTPWAPSSKGPKREGLEDKRLKHDGSDHEQDEHEHLDANEVAVVLGRAPARLLLHQLLNSQEMRRAVVASLSGGVARHSVRVHGLDIPIPAYLRVVSHLCHEVAEQVETEEEPRHDDHPRNFQDVAETESYPDRDAVLKEEEHPDKQAVMSLQESESWGDSQGRFGSDMPSPKGLQFYQGLPIGKDGTFDPNRGFGKEVKNWLNNVFSQLIPNYADARQKLNAAVNDYQNTLQRDSKAVEATYVPAGIIKLNKQMGGEVGKSVRNYTVMRGTVKQKVDMREIAKHNFEAALKDFEADADKLLKDEAQNEEKDLLKEQTADATGKKELMSFLWDLASAIKSGPGALLDIAKVGAKHLADVDGGDPVLSLRIDELGKKIQNLKLAADYHKLTADLERTKKAVIEYGVAGKELLSALAAADDIITSLANTETRSNDTTKVFRALNQYNNDMLKKGKALYSAASNYVVVIGSPHEHVLGSPILTGAARIDNFIQSDKETVKGSNVSQDTKNEFNVVASKIQDYISKLQAWQKQQANDLEKLCEAKKLLSSGTHQHPVEERMKKIGTIFGYQDHSDDRDIIVNP